MPTPQNKEEWFEASEAVPEIRRIWHKGEWYFSVEDMIAFRTGTEIPHIHWAILKTQLVRMGLNESHIEQLDLQPANNRFRTTDTMDRQSILCLLQFFDDVKRK